MSDFKFQAVATILPGRAYGHDRPLLRSAREVLAARGWTVRQVEWDIAPGTTPEQAQQAVRLLMQAPLEGVRARIHLVVAKSLGTLLLPAAMRLELPGVWLTPLLTDPQVAEAARTAQVPCLLIGGTADPYWRSDVAHGCAAEVLELAGAGHLLETDSGDDVAPGALRQVLEAVLAFADRVAAQTVIYEELVNPDN